MSTYSEVYTNDIDVELYFESLHLFHIEEYGDETDIIYVEFKEFEYTILKEHLMTSVTRQIAYLFVMWILSSLIITLSLNLKRRIIVVSVSLLVP
jgi:hypothetical protein